MGSDEAFCLKWNDFQGSISASLGSLQQELQDVTLQCGPQSSDSIHCHRLVLAACSDWFRNIFKSLTSSVTRHPVIVLWDAAARDMSLLLDFMYHGQVNVKQENLNSFLALAEKLSVRGLTQCEQSPQPQQRKSPSTSKQERRSVESPPGRRRSEDIEEVAVVKEEEQQARETEYVDVGEVVQFEGGYEADYFPADQSLDYSQDTANIVNSKGENICSVQFGPAHVHSVTWDTSRLL